MRCLRATALILLTSAAPEPQPLVPPTPPTEAASDLTFDITEDRMTVPVMIAAAGPYRFIIDTGSERTVISRELAATLGLAPGRRVNMTAMTGVSEVGTVIIPAISVSTLGGARIEAPALEARNLGAAGMLGIDSLQGHALAIDFATQTMSVAASAKHRAPPPAPDEIVIHARNMYGQLVVTSAAYRGRRVRVILDTGAAVSMGNPAFQRMVARAHGAIQPLRVTSVTGDSMQTQYTQIRAFQLGSITIQNLPVAFADAAPFRRFGLIEQPALMLGMDALGLFRHVRIDFPNNEVRLAVPRAVRRE